MSIDQVKEITTDLVAVLHETSSHLRCKPSTLGIVVGPCLIIHVSAILATELAS
jgi:hypothetical protein